MSSNPSEFAKDLVEKSYYDKYEAIEKVIKENKLDFARAFIAIDTGDHSRNRSLALRVSIDEGCIPLALEIIGINDFENQKDKLFLLKIAAGKGQREVVAALVESLGSFINTSEYQQSIQDVLAASIGSKNLEIFELLLSTTKLNIWQRIELIDCCYQNLNRDLVKKLVSDPLMSESDKNDLLDSITRNQDLEILETILRSTEDIRGWTWANILTLAIVRDNKEIVDILLEKKLSNRPIINEPFHAAIQKKDVALLEALLAKGDLNEGFSIRETDMEAIVSAPIEFVSFLYDKIGIKKEDHASFLKLSVFHNQPALFEYLLLKQPLERWTLIDIYREALKIQKLDYLKLLISTSPPDELCLTYILPEAIKVNNSEGFQTLLNLSNTKSPSFDSQRDTLFNQSISRKSFAIIQLLLDNGPIDPTSLKKGLIEAINNNFPLEIIKSLFERAPTLEPEEFRRLILSAVEHQNESVFFLLQELRPLDDKLKGDCLFVASVKQKRNVLEFLLKSQSSISQAQILKAIHWAYVQKCGLSLECFIEFSSLSDGLKETLKKFPFNLKYFYLYRLFSVDPKEIPDYKSLASISKILAATVLRSWGFKGDLDTIDLRWKELKDTNHRGSLLMLLMNLDDLKTKKKLDNEKLCELFFKLYDKSLPLDVTEQLGNAVTLALEEHSIEEILSDFSLESIQLKALKPMLDQGLIEKSEIAGFLSLSQTRAFSSVLLYAKRIMKGEYADSVKTAFKVFVSQLSSGSFQSFRNASNSYKDLLSSDQLAKWQTDSQEIINLDGHNYIVSDTDDWQDLFLSGTEVEGSCQRIDSDARTNKCLLGLLLNGKSRLICIKENENDSIRARAIFKIMKQRSGEPLLLLKHLYYATGVTRQISRDLIIEFAKKRAESIGLPLYQGRAEGGGSTEIISDVPNGVAPYEYEDGNLLPNTEAAQGITNGVSLVMADKIS